MTYFEATITSNSKGGRTRTDHRKVDFETTVLAPNGQVCTWVESYTLSKLSQYQQMLPSIVTNLAKPAIKAFVEP